MAEAPDELFSPTFMDAWRQIAIRLEIRKRRHLIQILKTFITSSPKWLITFTAILPVAGFAKGRDSAR